MSQKILVIDDDPEWLALLKTGLELDGFTILTARTGREGYRKAHEARPDVIVLDVMMSGMDDWIRPERLWGIDDTPIIPLAALASKKDVAKWLSLGADGCLVKPCAIGELKARILRVLRGKASSHGHWRGIPSDEGHWAGYDIGTVVV